MQLLSVAYSISILSFLLRLVAADELNNIEARQRKQDLSFCYSEGSICPQASQLYDQCQDLQNNFKDLNPWYECVCGNGYTATNRACNWCQAAYNLSYTVGIVDDQIERCQSLSYSIAPIPTQLIAVQSSFNATYTGIVPTADANSSPSTTGGSASSSGTAGETSRVAATATTSAITRTGSSARTSSAVISTITLNGGADGAGAARSSTTGSAQQQSATSIPSATPTGDAPSGGIGFAVILSVMMSASLALLLV
ncbi:hypothetical protein VTL71DRAFT_5779 [Oculimacula yallundae]|uniref:Uncharacterized protein n=1 Tax=Oculimacula yallundae TaxID=86028 RepID=A0ABR4BYL2_9HELO